MKKLKKKGNGYYLQVTSIILRRYRIGVQRYHCQPYMFLFWLVDYHTVLRDHRHLCRIFPLQQRLNLAALVRVPQQ
jgi:hypothetical protein